MYLANKTVAELKMIARTEGIDLPDGLKRQQILQALQAKGENVITSSEPVVNEQTSLTSNPSGITISPQPEQVKNEIVPEVKPKDDPNKVAIFAQKNLSWSGVGRLEKGYNFVTKGVADKWLTHKSVRSATPEEVASYYGVS